jgi:hypothetical protein
MSLRDRLSNPWIRAVWNLFFLAFTATWTVYCAACDLLLYALVNVVLILAFTGLFAGAIAEIRRRRRRLAR